MYQHFIWTYLLLDTPSLFSHLRIGPTCHHLPLSYLPKPSTLSPSHPPPPVPSVIVATACGPRGTARALAGPHRHPSGINAGADPDPLLRESGTSRSGRSIQSVHRRACSHSKYINENNITYRWVINIKYIKMVNLGKKEL